MDCGVCERMMAGRARFLCGAGLVAGVAGTIALRRITSRRSMPYLERWQRELARTRGEVAAAFLAARAQARYDQLYAERPRFRNRALRIHLEKSILPGLAMYQALCEADGDRSAALAEMERLFAVAFSWLVRQGEMLSHLPGAFSILRWTLRFQRPRVYPREGWEFETVEDNDRTTAFNARRCFYLDVLTQYGARELTATYCGIDDLACASLPPTIVWQRTKTLGRGGDCCDFRFSRGNGHVKQPTGSTV